VCVHVCVCVCVCVCVRVCVRVCVFVCVCEERARACECEREIESERERVGENACVHARERYIHAEYVYIHAAYVCTYLRIYIYARDEFICSLLTSLTKIYVCMCGCVFEEVGVKIARCISPPLLERRSSHACTHARMHAHTHTHTRSYAHACMYLSRPQHIDAHIGKVVS